MKLLTLALAAAGIAATPYEPAGELKCGRPADNPHYIIDGRFVDVGDRSDAELTRLTGGPDNIHSLALLCWDPVRRVLQHGSGEPVVHVTTHTFMATLHEDMKRLVAAQDAFRARHGSFAGRVSDLDVDIATSGLEIELTTSAGGWYASASGDLLRARCHVFAGSMTPPVARLEPREPVCASYNT